MPPRRIIQDRATFRLRLTGADVISAPGQIIRVTDIRPIHPHMTMIGPKRRRRDQLGSVPLDIYIDPVAAGAQSESRLRKLRLKLASLRGFRPTQRTQRKNTQRFHPCVLTVASLTLAATVAYICLRTLLAS